MPVIENPALMAGAFMGNVSPADRRAGGSLSDRIQQTTGRERTELDSSSRVQDFDTAIAEKIANRVHQLDKIEKKIGIRPEASKPFEDDEVTKFYVDELKKLVGDVGGMSRDMLEVQLKRMKGLMGDLTDSSSTEQKFLSEQYAQSLTFLQNEYKNRSGLIGRATAKMGDLAEQYMDVRSMYAGFVDDNPIAMALFRVAGDALKSHRDNKKAKKELIAADKHRSFMAEKTEEDKHDLLVREQARAEELEAMDDDIPSPEPETLERVAPEPVEPEVAESVVPEVSEPVISREDKVEGDALARMEKVGASTDDRLTGEFQRESITRDEKLFEKVSDIHDLIAGDSVEDKQDDKKGGLLSGLGKKFGPILKMAAPLLALVAPLMSLGLVGLAGAAGAAVGTWIYDEFLEGSAFADWLGETIYNIVEGVKQIGTNIVDFFADFGENMSSIGDMISGTVDIAFDSITGRYDDLSNWITEKFESLKAMFTLDDDTKEAIKHPIDWLGEKLFGDDANKANELNKKIGEERDRNSNTVGITGKVAPEGMYKSANDMRFDAQNYIQKQRDEAVVKDGMLIDKADLIAASNKNNLDAPVQRAQEEKIDTINQQVSDIAAEKQAMNANPAPINLTGKSQKKSVTGTGGGFQATTPLTIARNPDSSIARNIDKYYGRGMG